MHEHSQALSLHVAGLSLERGNHAVFRDLNFTARSGQLLWISGANGAGKTTLLRALAGIHAAAMGRILWSRASENISAKQAALFSEHAHAFNDALTVGENLHYAAALGGLPSSESSIKNALNQLKVAALINRPFAQLSQGQRKRTSLARLFLAAPASRAWLLDEPFVALDLETQALLAQLIAKEILCGGLVLLTSHQSIDIALPAAAQIEVRL